MTIIHVFLLIAAVLWLVGALVDDMTNWSATPQALNILSLLSLIIAIIYAFTP